VFRIEVFVDDKKLAAFLNAAAGLVASMSPPLPVVNAASKNGVLKAASSGNVPDTFHVELKKKKRKSFTIEELKAFLEAAGRAASSSNYVLKYMKGQRWVKMTKTRGLYAVIG
jgi:hypothetical protein